MPLRQAFAPTSVTPRQWLNKSCLSPHRAYLIRLNFVALSSPKLLDRKWRSFSSTAFWGQDVFHAQKEDPSSASFRSSLESSSPPKIPQTLTEKIVQRHSVGLPKGKIVKSGDYVTLSPYRCMTHDNSGPVVKKFKSIGASRIYDKNQIVITLDHDIQNKSEANLTKYQQIEDFAKQQGVVFYPAGRGIGHQIMVEEGWAYPSTLVVASDSHSNMYGGVGCLGTPVFTGTLPKGVTGKDVIVALCGLFSNDEVLNHAIEFTGSEETMNTLAVDDRLAIANMTTEWGALTGLFPIDSVLQRWLRFKATESALLQSDSPTVPAQFTHQRLDELFADQLIADRGAKYSKYLYLDLSTLSPYVSGPNSVKVATPLEELALQEVRIDKAYLVSCTNSRASDLAAAAKVFKDAAWSNNGNIPRIAEGVSFYIAAASQPEQIAAEEAGDWQAMLEAGAKPLPSGCGPCIGLGAGLLEPGEVGISSSNRNFKGRMGSTEAKAYLASPEVVAASALNGKISGPGWYERPQSWSGVIRGEGDGIREEDRMITAEEALEKVVRQLDSIVDNAEQDIHGPKSGAINETELTEILPGFPEKVEGEIVFCDADNINTDGIYPGKFTYQDDITVEKMAEVCMSNYDNKFSSITQDGDILVAGFSFGCGSSREQAATAILAKKIPLIVAGSFGNIFSRNSINNALMGVEAPRLIQRLRETFSRNEIDKSQQNMKQRNMNEPAQNRESLDSPPPAPQTAPTNERILTRRTGWKLVWDVKRSIIEIEEGKGGDRWSQKVGELPPNVQEIIARGGLENWVKKEIKALP
ncbi:MAG: hypothetical protein Q9167_002111 [Letrouitia subvulpina]